MLKKKEKQGEKVQKNKLYCANSTYSLQRYFILFRKYLVMLGFIYKESQYKNIR